MTNENTELKQNPEGGREASELSGLVMRYREGYHDEWPTVMCGDEPVGDLVGELNKLAAALEQYERTLLTWYAQQNDRVGRTGNAPGHGHDVPGVWDSDNGEIAGHECAECALWKMAETLTHNAALRGAEPVSSAERPLEGTVMRKEE